MDHSVTSILKPTRIPFGQVKVDSETSRRKEAKFEREFDWWTESGVCYLTLRDVLVTIIEETPVVGNKITYTTLHCHVVTQYDNQSLGPNIVDFLTSQNALLETVNIGDI